MTSSEFVQELRDKVRAFCATLDERPPAYSYVPLSTDAERLRVMKSRLWNELRAADLFGGWLKTTPEVEVKTMMARSAHEEMVHAGLLSARIRDLGADPFDYRPLPAQMSMFNAMEGLPDSCQRLAGFSMGGEGIANYLIEKCSGRALGPRLDQGPLPAHPGRRGGSRQRSRGNPGALRHHPGDPGRHAPGRGHAPGADAGVPWQPGSMGHE